LEVIRPVNTIIFRCGKDLSITIENFSIIHLSQSLPLFRHKRNI
jgi:hypothetical protein